VKIKHHANQKTNTGTGKGSNVLNYRLKHSSTGLPMPTPAKKWKIKLLHKCDKNTYNFSLGYHDLVLVILVYHKPESQLPRHPAVVKWCPRINTGWNTIYGKKDQQYDAERTLSLAECCYMRLL
jgi:hypothetical protein